MERIVLEVDDTVGKIYQSLSKETKKYIDKTISLMVKKAVNDVNYSDYKKLLDELGNEAARNGLTPQILEELLANDE